MTTLPKITNKQKQILQLLYRHRFLNRIQIQALLQHQDKSRSSKWLKDLKEKGYIAWIYDRDDFINKTKPATYYLALNGIRYLRELAVYPSEELRKRYKESTRQKDFISRCLLLADCCIDWEAKSVGNSSYAYKLYTDYINPESGHYFLEALRPNACVVKQDKTRNGTLTTNYLLEIFDSTTPRHRVKKRIKEYVQLLVEAIWEDETQEQGPPTILLAFPTKAELTYAKRRTNKELEDIYSDDIPKDVKIRFATTEQIREHGVTARIWEKLKSRRV
jgi:hypothetical protein